MSVEKHPLYPVFTRAITQATIGKGTRHGGDATPFFEQRWYRIASGPAGVQGLAFQAIKKLEEALEKPNREDFERELLGAMVYMGMVYLKELGDPNQEVIDELV